MSKIIFRKLSLLLPVVSILTLQGCTLSQAPSTNVPPPAELTERIPDAPKPKIGEDRNSYDGHLLDWGFGCAIRNDGWNDYYREVIAHAN